MDRTKLLDEANQGFPTYWSSLHSENPELPELPENVKVTKVKFTTRPLGTNRLHAIIVMKIGTQAPTLSGGLELEQGSNEHDWVFVWGDQTSTLIASHFADYFVAHLAHLGFKVEDGVGDGEYTLVS